MQPDLQPSPEADLISDAGFAQALRQLDESQQIDQNWARTSCTLSREIEAASEEYCRIHDLSRECLFLAAWSQILRCYGGSDESVRIVSCNDPTFDRKLPASSWPNVESDPVLSDWLRSLDRLIWEAPRDADVRIDDERSSTSPHNQLKGINSVLALWTDGESAAPGQFLQSVQARENTIVVEVASQIETILSLCYPVRRFSHKFIEIILHCFTHIYVQIAGGTGNRFSEVSLVPANLRPRLAASSPRSQAPFRRCAHEMIEQQCLRAPEQTAGICNGRTISYGELNARSNQLARYLQDNGCGPEVLVAIHMGRSLDLLVAILAVLKAGAAFLPLDAVLPIGRVRAVMEDSCARFVITTSSMAGRFDTSTAQVLVLDGSACPWNGGSSQTPATPTCPENLAYVIYTSGSTGKPKGVMIEHRNLSSFITAMDEVLGSEPGVWLAVGSISFDISIIELIWTLARGFLIVLHEGDRGIPLMLGPDSVPQQMIRYGVTHLAGTPTLMRMLAGCEGAAAPFASVRVCFVGGEAFPSDLAPLLLRLGASGVVINAYGPTESTVAATYHRVHSLAQTIPIGKALSNTSLYVVDRWNRPLPPLAAGELLIGGSGVGRGYLNRPELTEARFIPNGYDPTDQGLLYRSGDLVYTDLSGDLHFIDRLDSQVKVRGYRIELSEIEAVLLGHPEILEAAVIVKDDAVHGKSLVGFYKGKQQLTIHSGVLRSYLKEALPSYMVPAVLCSLQHFPLTPTGKLDRSALAKSIAVEPLQNREATDGDGPKSRVEADLCCWFAELLQLPLVWPADDFFELGGQSIIAAQLMARVAARFGVTLRLSVLVEARSARALAKKIGEAKGQSGEAWSPVVPIRRGGFKPPLFIIAGLGGNVVNFEFIAAKVPDRPIYGVETYGLNAQAEALVSVKDMARAYLTEIRRVYPSGPYHLAGYSFGGIVAFEMAQQLRSSGLPVGLLGLIDTVEWRYASRVISELSFWDSWNLHYGHTINRIVAGPNRRKTLAKRLATFWEHRSFALRRAAGRKQKSSAEGSPEQRNYYAAQRYLPTSYGGEVHLFRCPEKSLRRGNDPLLGWGALCQTLKVTEIEGEHEQITAEPFASFLGSAIRNSLDSVESGSVSALTGLQTALHAFDAALTA